MGKRRSRLRLVTTDDPIVEDLRRIIVEMNRNHPEIGPLFSAHAGRWAAREVMRAMLADYAGRQNLVDFAEAGWGPAQEFLREIIAEMTSLGLSIPLEFQAYNLKVGAGRVGSPLGVRGPDRRDRAFAGLLTAMLVEYVRTHHGLDEYGLDGCCAKVADAAARSVHSVEKAWEVWRKVLARGGPTLDIFERSTT